MDGSALDEIYFKILGLSSSYKLGWWFYLVPIAKTVSRKLEPFISLCFIFTDLSYSFAWNTVVMSGLVCLCMLLSDIWLCWIWRTVSSTLDASLEPLSHLQIVPSLSLFYRYYFGWCSSRLTELVLLPYPSWGPLNII